MSSEMVVTKSLTRASPDALDIRCSCCCLCWWQLAPVPKA